MKTFTVISQDGEPLFTMSPGHDDEHHDGEILPNGNILREFPNFISSSIVLSTWYWEDGWKLKPERPGDFYNWNSSTRSWVPDVASSKKQKKDSVNKLREEKLGFSLIHNAKDVEYNGNIFDNSNRTRSNLSELLNLINSGVPLPEGFVFRSKSNFNVPFSEQDIKNLLLLLITYKNSCYEYSWSIKEQIDSLTTVEEIEAFDINQGWPE